MTGSTAASTEAYAWDELAAAMSGTLVLPGDAGWDEARKAWNLALDQRPVAVAAVTDADDVQAVVRHAGAHGLRVAPQRTGHGATALGALDGTILLKTTGLTGVTVDPQAGTARVGAGTLWRDVVDAAAPHGLAALAGSAPDVSVAGYTLGGGTGWLARRHGLSVNSVVSAEVVTGDGERRRIDAENEPDLFWAVRGGGGVGAVVTELELRLVPVRDVYAGFLLFPLERAREVLLAYDRWVSSVPDDVSTSFRLLRVPPLPDIPEPLRGGEFAAIDGCVLGEVADGERLLAPLRELGPSIDMWQTMPAAALGMIHMDPPEPVPAAADGTSVAALPIAAVDVLLDIAGPGVESPLLALELRQLGGAISRGVTGGGVVDRIRGRYLVYAVGVAPDPATAVAVQDAAVRVKVGLAPWGTETTYLNFTETQEPAARYWGAEVGRLREVVSRYDPSGVVRPAHPLT